MDYEGKFRDFIVGWLANQVKEPDANREDLENLYDEVVDAENDRGALSRVEMALGKETAQKLRALSQQWHDPTVDQARPMIEALRERVQEETRDHTQFYLFFLNPFEDGCVPSGFEDRLEQEICWMFRVFYGTVSAVVLAAKGWEPEVIVEPSYEDTSNIIILAHPQAEFFSKVFVHQSWHKAWHLHFDSLPELAGELLRQHQAIEQTLTKATGAQQALNTGLFTNAPAMTVESPSLDVSLRPELRPRGPVEPLKVKIEVLRGVAYVVEKPPDVQVEIIDQDVLKGE